MSLQTSDCGMHCYLFFQYKPFMWCRFRRPTVACTVIYSLNISPLCDVAQPSDCGTHCHLHFNISPLCGVALTPDCGIVILYLPFRGVFQTLDWPSVLLWDFGRTTARLLFYFPCVIIPLSECALLICSYASCLHLLYLMSILSCEYFHKLTWLVDLARCWRRRSYGWRVR